MLVSTITIASHENEIFVRRYGVLGEWYDSIIVYVLLDVIIGRIVVIWRKERYRS